ADIAGILQRPRSRTGAKTGKMLLDFAHELVMADRSCRDHDHPVGAILLLQEPVQILRPDGFHRFRRAEDRTADGLMPEGRLGEAVEDNVIWRVVSRDHL